MSTRPFSPNSALIAVALLVGCKTDLPRRGVEEAYVSERLCRRFDYRTALDLASACVRSGCESQSNDILCQAEAEYKKMIRAVSNLNESSRLPPFRRLACDPVRVADSSCDGSGLYVTLLDTIEPRT